MLAELFVLHYGFGSRESGVNFGCFKNGLIRSIFNPLGMLRLLVKKKATYVSRQLFFGIFVYMFGISWIEYMGRKNDPGYCCVEF